MNRFTERMDRFVNEFVRVNDFSAAVRITYKGDILYQCFKGCSDYENNLPFSEKSLFNFYSLSKPFCAIGLMKLKDKGMIDIDSHPGKYIPEAKGFDEKVTIRQILHHTSGLPDFVQTEGYREKYPYTPGKDPRFYLEKLTGFPMFFAPGCGAKYTNANFVICALAIENITGLKYADYMRREVFAPLGMETALVDCEGLEVANRVKGYEVREGKPRYVGNTLEWMLGAGDILGTLDDVYCLNRAIKNASMLKKETWEEILTPSPLNKMGMGCTISRWHDKYRIRHNGGSLGFRTYHVQLPEDDFDIILLSNFDGEKDIRPVFAEGVYEAFYGVDHLPSDHVEMDKGYI